MFSLLAGAYEYVVSRPEKRCLFLGLDYAGKTTVMEQLKAGFGLKHMDLSKLPPTIGFNVAKICISGVDAIFWDLGGHKNFRVVWQNYFSECDAIVFVVDSGDTKRLEEAKEVLDTVLKHPLISSDIPILILANKQDLQGAMSLQELGQKLETKRLETERTAAVRLQPCSALKNDGLADGVKWLLEETLRNPRGPPLVR
ncbi:unnamed protein product [Amoebophrya sp. A120]|nr:unnamed protein product [Amoebophrya sp. A120]|eukprot:GSA120T00002759001.1